MATGQTATEKTTERPKPLASEGARATRRRREAWFLKGRILPGVPAATLANRAYQQKLLRRAGAVTRPAKASAQAASTSLASGSGWISLGPTSFPSNASSNGFQLYGPVSGRATAVAIDPADTSGNTVYVGGANGGLWQSTNAATNPSAVQWTPLIDDQPSLAVGAIAVQSPQSTPGSTVVLVGTGETNSSADSYYGRGILRGVFTAASNSWACGRRPVFRASRN